MKYQMNKKREKKKRERKRPAVLQSCHDPPGKECNYSVSFKTLSLQNYLRPSSLILLYCSFCLSTDIIPKKDRAQEISNGGISFKQFALETNGTISQHLEMFALKAIIGLNESFLQFVSIRSFPNSILSPLMQVIEVMELLQWI